MEYKITLTLGNGETVVTSFPMDRYDLMVQLVMSYVDEKKNFKYEIVNFK